VACPSGLRSTPRKRVWVQAHRGFKSHRHRQPASQESSTQPWLSDRQEVVGTAVSFLSIVVDGYPWRTLMTGRPARFTQ
jgi:hypothetical protein